MAISFKLYADPGLTQELTSLEVTRPTTGDGFSDRVVYLGSQYTDTRYLSSGEDFIEMYILDALEETGDLLPAHVKLALSSAGLDTADPNTWLEIPSPIYCGPANAVAVHVRITTPALGAAVFTNLSLATMNVYEAGI